MRGKKETNLVNKPKDDTLKRPTEQITGYSDF